MYLEHFGLKELPFSITADTAFFMNRAGHQDALNVMLVALRSGEGFIKVTGEVGVGKTLLCHKLIKTLTPEFAAAYIYNPYLNPEGLISALADELQVAYAETAGPNQILKAVTRRLTELHQAGRRVVLCLDEVQAMPIRTLEVLRLITNLETEKRKLVQVVLFGQPELDSLLEHPAVRQLKQRITFSYLLLPMNRIAVRAYVRHRLRVAGGRGPDLFSDSAVTALSRASKGIPRLINILSHKAMMAAFGEGDDRIRPRHVQAAIRDTLEAQQTRLRGLAAWMPNFHRWLFGAPLTGARR
ncbi:MAG: AAA family ATPase [Gammaproteobacteria bacterium]|nr:AAA family ATPase [Gammaproteobacteria bacterium]